MSRLPSVEVFGRAVATVLEESAFVLTEPSPPQSAALCEGWVAEVRFAAFAPGVIRLYVPGELAITFCAGLLGKELDDEGVAEGGPDAVGEVTNMVAGALLPAWLGEAVEYELGTPEVRTLSQVGSVFEPHHDALSVWLVTEEGLPMMAQVQLGESP